MSLLGKQWVIQNEGDDRLMEKLLLNRALDSDEKRQAFFEGGLELVHDPFLLKDMQKAVDRLRIAIEKQEKIMVFGDYDVDGITGAALLYDGLKKMGAHVDYTLPHREDDGYGLKDYFIERFKEEGVQLIVTVDCGTANLKEIELANNLGMEVIVTDHHSMPKTLPSAYAIVNPHQPNCEYPNPEICGSTIAYKLIIALSKGLMDEAGRKEYLMQQLSVVCLGVIGDCMPLSGENRVLVKYGLKSLRDGHNAGLITLLEQAGIDTKTINSTTIGFQIGPRLNAAGRMDKPDHSLELILGNVEKATVLNRLNQLRREVVKGHIDTVVAKLEALEEIPNIIVLWNKDWPAGILGLIASRMVDKYQRPTIAMQEREKELVGSCRSLKGFDITGCLREACGELFEAFGGHPMAGGFTLPKDHLQVLVQRVEQAGQTQIDPTQLPKTLQIDCEIKPHEMNMTTCATMDTMRPFGLGNPEPTLVIRNTKLLSLRPVGKEGEHLQFPLECGGEKFQAIAFRMGKHIDKIDTTQPYDIAFTMEVNRWNGRSRLQLKVLDMQPSN